jgi:transcriptional regulator with XRE-family HTH domain
MEIALKLLKLIAEKKVTKTHIYETAELSPSGLEIILNGKSSPSIKTLTKILKAMDTDLETFFSGKKCETCAVYSNANYYKNKTIELQEDLIKLLKEKCSSTKNQ